MPSARSKGEGPSMFDLSTKRDFASWPADQSETQPTS